MKFSISILAGLLSISSMAAGNIISIALPEQIRVDDSFNCQLSSIGDERKITYVSAAFGAAPIKDARAKMLGTAILGQKTFNLRTRSKLFLFTIETPPAGVTLCALFTDRPILCY